MPAMAGSFSVAGIDNDAEVHAFLRDLQAALKARDKTAIAGMLSTNVRVFNDGKAQSKTAKAALTRFDDVFDPYVTAVIQCQTPDSLWANWRGLSIGRGTVWVNLELQVSTKTYDKNPEQYPSSDRRYWKMKISTINRGKNSKESAAECP
jgi:hypothetical protein